MVPENPTTAADPGTVTSLAVDAGSERLVEVDQLILQLRGFIRLMKRGITQLAPSLRREGVEYAAYALLGHVVLEGPKRITVLAEAVHADPSTVSRQTAALVRHGLLERRPDPEDGRASILAATPEGLRVFEENRRHSCTLLAEMLSDWTTEELQQLNSLLARASGDVGRFYQQLELDQQGSVLDFKARRT